MGVRSYPPAPRPLASQLVRGAASCAASSGGSGGGALPLRGKGAGAGVRRRDARRGARAEHEPAAQASGGACGTGAAARAPFARPSRHRRYFLQYVEFRSLQ